MDIQTKTECDKPERCSVCYYNDEKAEHSGEINARYISCDYLQFGDYDNSGAVERANVRYAKENFSDCYIETGSYGYEKAWIPDTEENREIINALSDYPCFNDEIVSEIEREIEEEYIKDNDDLWRATAEPLKGILDNMNMRCLDTELYYKACEIDNSYFIVESGGNGWIDLARLAPTYNKLLREKYPFLQYLEDLQQVVDNVPSFPLDMYEDATDMLQHADATGRVLTEETRALLQYSIELETLVSSLRGVLT